MSLDYIISVSVLINPIYRIPRAIGKRTMAGIFRSHGIHGSPSRGEGVVHAGAEVEEAQVSGAEALLLLGGVAPAVAEVVCGVGEGKPRAEGQVVVLLHNGGGHHVGGEQAVAVISFNSITDS